MLDPFSALGLASNVVQFVDFGTKILSESAEIYKSAGGASVGSVELETIYGNLSDISSRLKASNLPLGNWQEHQEEVRALRKLASSCGDVADELLSTRHNLSTEASRHRKWRSFRQALLNNWTKSKVEGLQKRLDGFCRQLTLQLAELMQKQQLEIINGIQNLEIESRRLFSEQKTQLGQLGENLERSLDRVDKKPSSSHIDQAMTVLSKTLSLASEVSMEQQILRSLYFRSLDARHAKISEAHQETFEWIFKSESRTSTGRCSEIKLLNWLRHQRGIYWVSGNPGSGKSTLMKYLCDHKTTEAALNTWAQGKKVITAKFFFWNAGHDLQKSSEGLLRSLLFEILRKCPVLIQTVCAPRWHMIEQNDTSLEWDALELSQMFDRLVQENIESSKSCFFIDGLDEYVGDHQEMVHVLSALSKWTHIKLCLSSRPWDVFEDAFGQNVDYKLYLHDLTRGDIELYVRNNLESHNALADLDMEDRAQYQVLIEEIVDKSKGVFLWVFLVTKSFYSGLTQGDTMSVLERKLRLLPTDLEAFFQHIIDQVDKAYQSDMARTFQASLENEGPLTLLFHSFLDEPNPNFAAELSIGIMDESKVKSRISMMRRRINARCKGLMEVESAFIPESSSHRVEFLHRTVRDFLLTRRMQQMLNSHMDKSVNIHRSLCKAYLASFQTVPSEVPLLNLVENIMQLSQRAEATTGISDCKVLDELGRTYEFWSNSSRIYVRKKVPETASETAYVNLFSLAIENGLNIYIREKLDLDTPDQAENARMILNSFYLPDFRLSEPSLHWAFWLLGIAADYHAVKHFGLRLQTLNMFVRESADPNDRHLSGTVIDALLEWLHSVREVNKTEVETRYLFDIVDTLIKHGATPNLCSFQGHTRVPKNPEIPLEQTFGQFPPDLAALLFKGLQQKAEPPVSPSKTPQQKSELPLSSQPSRRHKFRMWLNS